MLANFRFEKGKDRWVEGTIYDAGNGKTYDCYLWFEKGKPDILRVCLTRLPASPSTRPSLGILPWRRNADPGFRQIASTSDEESLEAFASVAQSPTEALVQVGTGLPILHLIEELERRFDLPVIASNPAGSWQGLRAAGITDVVPGAGRLFKASPIS